MYVNKPTNQRQRPQCVNSAASDHPANKITAKMRSVLDSSQPMPLQPQSGRPTRPRPLRGGRSEEPEATPTRKRKVAEMMIQMVPSGGFQPPNCSATAAASPVDGRPDAYDSALKASEVSVTSSACDDDDNGQQTRWHRSPRQDLPTLFDIPSSIYPAYRPMPALVRFALVAMSITLSATATYIKSIRGGDAHQWRMSLANIVKFVLRAALIATVSIAALQEAFLRPSRITTSTLLEKGWLPSTLSKFERLTTTIPSLGNVGVGPLGVHYLEYKNSSTHSPCRFDVLHCNHGFGASSLSWLPALPVLTDRLGARVSLAHDAVGFGFTDRPPATKGRREDLAPYSLTASAALGSILVENALIGATNNGTDDVAPTGTADATKSKDQEEIGVSPPRSVALFGHSMGCTSTLLMALSLPRDVKKLVVLVAPALLLSTKGTSNGEASSSSTDLGMPTSQDKLKPRCKFRRVLDRVSAAFRKTLIDLPLVYFLRRLVGKASFWTDSLRLAVWGNPDDVLETDGLRFQYPTIGKGWEEGLLAFTRSRLLGVDSCPGGDDALMENVLKMPNTSVVIITGLNDKVIPPSTTRDIAKRYASQVRYVELEGRGHDPFEEDVDEFTNVVERLLGEM